MRTLAALLVLYISTSPVHASLISIPASPDVPPKSGGPPLGVLRYEWTADSAAILEGLSDVSRVPYFEYTRIGDFNDPTEEVDQNQTPLEGTAVYLLSSTQPALETLVSKNPGGELDGQATTFQTLVERSALLSSVSGQVVRLALYVGNSVDEHGMIQGRFVFAIPEPNSLALVATFPAAAYAIRKQNRRRTAPRG